MILWFWA